MIDRNEPEYAVLDNGELIPLPLLPEGTSFVPHPMSGNGKMIIGEKRSTGQTVWTEKEGYLTDYTETFKAVSSDGRYLVNASDLNDLETGNTSPIDFSESEVNAVAVEAEGVVIGTRTYNSYTREATSW